MSDDSVTFVDPEDEIDLWHYASKYYDPVKAREYYLRTRELKGREASTEQLSTESRQRQAEAKTYVQAQIRDQSANAQKQALESQQVRLEKLRETAVATRDRIVEKLAKLIENLRADLEKEVPKPTLNKISATASPRQRAFLEKQNARMMSEYNGKVRRAQKKANTAASEATKAAREEIKKVGTDLKEAVSKVREDYKKARDEITAKYSSDLKNEIQNIEKQVR